MTTLPLAIQWYGIDTWIVLTGMICAMACALPGNFLVLRKMSMMGDAISHAVLPGLAVAFLITESRSSLTMFIGAAAVGVLTALFTQWVHSFGRVDTGAAMGIVFTTLFAIGLLLIVRAADHVDLDASCVLYGAIEVAPLDTWQVPGFAMGEGAAAFLGDSFNTRAWEVPRAAIVLLIVFLINAVFIGLFFKELKISAFDPALATTLGIHANLMHYLLMTIVAVTTVAAFESIGSILVIAMLVVPAAAAHLLTDRLGAMIFISLAVAAASAVLGHVLAIAVPAAFGLGDPTTAGMMAAAAGGLFLLALLAAPRHGLVARLAHQHRLALRIIREDILGLMYRLEELQRADEHRMGLRQFREALKTGPLMARLALWQLNQRRLLQRFKTGHHTLTEAGRARAKELVRAHRLWETYLVQQAGVPAEHVHDGAERLEHARELTCKLDDTLGHPSVDPHGARIPRQDQTA